MFLVGNEFFVSALRLVRKGEGRTSHTGTALLKFKCRGFRGTNEILLKLTHSTEA